MSERWKPGNLEKYFYVGRDFEAYNAIWVEDFPEKTRWKKGNCFKTEAEAKAAAEKVKALLLSLHEDVKVNTKEKPLPKLTVEVFNHPDCPEWAKYAAVDLNGIAHYYDERPYLMDTFFYNSHAHTWTVMGEFDSSDWKNSLIERPAKLPDWCKVGEWVYSIPAKKYDKIIAIQDFRIVTREMKYTDDYINDGNVVQARLRPYNAEEMKALVGKVIAHLPTGDVSFVTGFCNGTKKIYSGTNCFIAEILLKDFTINNAPCGVLEHLENGEWVE